MCAITAVLQIAICYKLKKSALKSFPFVSHWSWLSNERGILFRVHLPTHFAIDRKTFAIKKHNKVSGKLETNKQILISLLQLLLLLMQLTSVLIFANRQCK